MYIGTCGYCKERYQTKAGKKIINEAHAVCNGKYNSKSLLKYVENDRPVYKQINGELWHNVIGYPGYWVNRKGELLNRHGRKSKLGHSRGYPSVRLVTTTHKKNFLIHRLVAEYFIPNDDPLNKTQVHHKNHIKTDNRVENLEWVTPSRNIKYNFEDKTRPRPKGTLNILAKLTDEEVKEIYRNEDKITIRELAQRYNVSTGTIDNIRYKKTWTHITNKIDKGEI